MPQGQRYVSSFDGSVTLLFVRWISLKYSLLSGRSVLLSLHSLMIPSRLCHQSKNAFLFDCTAMIELLGRGLPIKIPIKSITWDIVACLGPSVVLPLRL